MDWRQWLEKPNSNIGSEGVSTLVYRAPAAKLQAINRVPKNDDHDHGLETSESHTVDLITWTSGNFQNAEASNQEITPGPTKDADSASVIAHDRNANAGSPGPLEISEMVMLAVADEEVEKYKNGSPRTPSEQKMSESSSRTCQSHDFKTSNHRAMFTPSNGPEAEGGFPQFQIGQQVEAQYLNGAWYPAEISEVKRDGQFYLVSWEDGDPIDRLKCVDEVCY
jgi:hypothetical protein